MWQNVLKEMSEDDKIYYEDFFNALAEMTEDKLSGNVKDIFEEIVRLYDDYENDCSAVENIYNSALKFINAYKIQNLLMPYMGSQVIKPMVETNKEEYDSEWQETLKGYGNSREGQRIMSQAIRNYGYKYLFQNKDDERIPHDNPQKHGGYAQLYFIERHPNDQHTNEPHKLQLPTSAVQDSTRFKEVAGKRLPQISDEATEEDGANPTDPAWVEEKKHKKKKARFYSELKDKHADKAWDKYKLKYNLPSL